MLWETAKGTYKWHSHVEITQSVIKLTRKFYRVEDISIDSIKYQARFDRFTYTFLYNPKNEHIKIIDKQ